MRLLTFLLCFLLLASPAAAETWPTHAVRVMVPFAAGGPADTLARVVGDKLSLAWGQPVVVENRGGAGGNIGAELAARAAPDGYTLLVNPSNHVINASLYDKLPYDPLADFTPLTEMASYMLVLVVHPSVPATTLAEFVAWARAQPKGLAIANASTGSPTHLTAALFAQAAGLDFVHVSYRGAAPANADLLGGQVKAMFNNPINALPQIRAGALRALAVTGRERLALLPDVPTVAEEGYPGFEASTWYGLFAPAGVRPALAAKISADAIAALKLPDVQEKLSQQGFDVIAGDPSAFAALLKTELAKWAAVIKATGLKGE
ncbi:MAG TPA: tripartite tricarboxylate transporter substrate binding protein [Xanthobacteraceae bacterium]|jgi:tripartite-type tricarboxylate transporter receptor subunit TctC|nr:tripartite tricarboxylate transporter substrate binding protein [Xanthobacteraceae bacterium]